MENVEGHVTIGLREVTSELEQLGYKTTWGIFSAREIGAPHQRKRVYIMADCDNGLMGNSKHHGSSSTQIRGSNTETARGPEKGSEEAEQSSRASRRSNNESLSSSVAYTESYGGRRELRQLPKANESVRESQEYRENEASKSYDAGQNGAGSVGDTNGAGQQAQRNEPRPQRQTPATCESGELGDTKNHGLSSGIKNFEREGSEGITERSKQDLRSKSDRPSGARVGIWPAEPRLGRVVDGCPNRVDRLRLLGNGVVPQTAAKAWMVLSHQLENKN